MTRQQILVIASAIALFLVLYFGCDTKSKEQHKNDQSRSLVAESADPEAMLRDARAQLPDSLSAVLQPLEQQLQANTADTVKTLTTLKALAHFWYEAEKPVVSGIYAERVARIENTEDSWSTAASTFYIGLQQSASRELRDFCSGRAVKALENAISLNPASIDHKVNLALCYAENPPQDNPMKGILMLRELDQQNPDNPKVLIQLGRLAIKTGQFDRAIARLEKVVSLEPSNGKAYCLLAEAYRGGGKTAEAEKAEGKCKQK